MTSVNELKVENLWVSNLDMVMHGTAVAADLDGDGYKEFVTAAYQAIISDDGMGEELWHFETKHRYMAPPAALDIGEPT